MRHSLSPITLSVEWCRNAPLAGRVHSPHLSRDGDYRVSRVIESPIVRATYKPSGYSFEGDPVHLGARFSRNATAESAARLTRQLLAYAGRREPEVCSVDLSAHTRSMSDLLRSSVPKSVSLELDLDEELPPIHADLVQIEQMIMNLILNAVEAVGEREGEVRVSTRACVVDAREIATWIAPDTRAPGSYVCLEVSDTGCGMDDATRVRIFDPFFTTKELGHGLGLSTVLGLVRGHLGGVSISSQPNAGTTIKIFLPSRPDAGQPSNTSR